jgi:hypothetical protein
MPTDTSGVLHRPTALRESFRPAFDGPQPCAVLREASTLDELTASFVDRRYGYPDALWGSTPIKTFISAHTSVSVEPLPLAREGQSDFGRCSHTSFE